MNYDGSSFGDSKRAYELASKASASGNAQAQLLMATFSDYGIGCPLDLHKRIEYLKLAATAGNIEAQGLARQSLRSRIRRSHRSPTGAKVADRCRRQG